MSDNHHLQISKCPLGEVCHLDLLSVNIGMLYMNEEYADVLFIVEGNKFPAHKFILASRSEYFRALLYGGMRESLPDCNEIELKDAPYQAFTILLKYIYTGKMNLMALKEEIILETLGLSNQYGFTNLESSISDYLKAILTVKNVCLIFDMANLYRLASLRETCFQFMDRHSADIIKQRIYLSLSASAMHDMIRRDSFCAKEADIFKAVHEWSQANPSSDPTEILSAVRYPLLTLQEIMDIVRPTSLIPPDQLLDAIREKFEKRNFELNYRGFLAPEENIATFRHGALVFLGEKRTALLDGDTTNYDLDRGFTRHPIEDPISTNLCGGLKGPSGIILKLGAQCIINHIKLLLWDKDLRSYSYYLETSVDQSDWVRVVDHSKYLCRSWQNLFFAPRVARFIKIVGTHNTVNRVFHIVHLEAMYTCRPYKLVDGLIFPNENVASLTASACVIDGVSRSKNALINGDYKNYDWDSGYTCHQLGSGSIIIQLAQPYVVSSLRMLLWDCDDRSYRYMIKTSIDQVSWDLIVDKTNEPCKSWQNLTFKPRPVIFIKIEGTQNTANEVFHCVHFECPNTLMLETTPISASPSMPNIKNLIPSSCNSDPSVFSTMRPPIGNNDMNQDSEYFFNEPTSTPPPSLKRYSLASHHNYLTEGGDLEGEPSTSASIFQRATQFYYHHPTTSGPQTNGGHLIDNDYCVAITPLPPTLSFFRPAGLSYPPSTSSTGAAPPGLESGSNPGHEGIKFTTHYPTLTNLSSAHHGRKADEKFLGNGIISGPDNLSALLLRKLTDPASLPPYPTDNTTNDESGIDPAFYLDTRSCFNNPDEETGTDSAPIIPNQSGSPFGINSNLSAMIHPPEPERIRLEMDHDGPNVSGSSSNDVTDNNTPFKNSTYPPTDRCNSVSQEDNSNLYNRSPWIISTPPSSFYFASLTTSANNVITTPIPDPSRTLSAGPFNALEFANCTLTPASSSSSSSVSSIIRHRGDENVSLGSSKFMPAGSMEESNKSHLSQSCCKKRGLLSLQPEDEQKFSDPSPSHFGFSGFLNQTTACSSAVTAPSVFTILASNTNNNNNTTSSPSSVYTPHFLINNNDSHHHLYYNNTKTASNLQGNSCDTSGNTISAATVNAGNQLLRYEISPTPSAPVYNCFHRNNTNNNNNNEEATSSSSFNQPLQAQQLISRRNSVVLERRSSTNGLITTGPNFTMSLLRPREFSANASSSRNSFMTDNTSGKRSNSNRLTTPFDYEYKKK